MGVVLPSAGAGLSRREDAARHTCECIGEASRADEYDLSIQQFEARLNKLGTETWRHPDAQRLSQRRLKYSEQLLTFLRDSDNNPGELAIRPAVMIRKTSYANPSQQGATTQSILMTIFRTLRLRNRQPIGTILAAQAT
ncbi:MAG: transposase [Planctomycetaceae bacterium]